jgi:DNA invertase Pin-like site-specific DNA recombinase
MPVACPVVIAYMRCSTNEQADSGLGLAAQRVILEAECTRREWSNVEWIEDAGYSARTLKRPGLTAALERLASGQAHVLLSKSADRLSRSLKDFCDLTERSQREGWSVCALDAPADPLTPHGRAMQAMQIVFSQLERDLVSSRTRDALAAKRSSGVRLGRQRVISDDLRNRILRLRHEDGYSYGVIARQLNAAGVPLPAGGRTWFPASVRKIVVAAEAA